MRRWLLSHIDIPSRCVRWCTCLAVRETCIYKNTPDMATLVYIVCGSVTASQTSMSYTIDSRCSCSSHSKRHACRSLATTPYTPVPPTTHVRLGRPSAQPTASTGYLQFDGSNSHTCCIHRPLTTCTTVAHYRAIPARLVLSSHNHRPNSLNITSSLHRESLHGTLPIGSPECILVSRGVKRAT